MKLHEVTKRLQAMGMPIKANVEKPDQRRILQELGFEPDNFYQEIEMDYPLVQTQEDVSTARDVVELHSHSYYEIIFVRSGNLQYLIGTQRYRVQRGDILLIAPGISHRPLFLERLAEPYGRYVIWLSADCASLLHQQWPFLQKLSAGPCMLRTADLPGDSIAYFESTFRHGVKEAQAAIPGWQAEVFANTLSLLVALHRTFNSGSAPQPPVEKRELLDEIMAYVENHLAERITLEDTARQFHVSESTVSQLFRKRLSVSYYRYVTQRRLIAAKTLILEDTPLEAVAEQVGFSDYSGFYRAFKQEYGISPTKFKALP